MLVLSRKKNEKILIGNEVTLVVVEIRGDKVRIGIDAPKDFPVHRGEVFEDIVRRTGKEPASGLGQVGVELEELVSYAACSRLKNTPEFLDGLAERLNSVLAFVQDDSRVQIENDGMRIVDLPY